MLHVSWWARFVSPTISYLLLQSKAVITAHASLFLFSSILCNTILLNDMHIGDRYRDFPLRPACCRKGLLELGAGNVVLSDDTFLLLVLCLPFCVPVRARDVTEVWVFILFRVQTVSTLFRAWSREQFSKEIWDGKFASIDLKSYAFRLRNPVPPLPLVCHCVCEAFTSSSFSS